MRVPPLNPIRNFEAAARGGSFKRAAEELCVTEGAVSRQIKVLESYLGIQLFQRGGRQMTLTDAGKRLFPVVRDALASLTHAAHEVAEQQKALRLETTTSFALRWLMPRLHKFEKLAPDVKISLQTSTADTQYPPPQRMDASVIYLLDPPHDDSRLHHVIDEYLMPVCAPRLLSAGRPMEVAQLAGQRLLFNESTGRDWRRWARSMGISDLPWDKAMKFDSDDAAIQAAVAGHGIALANIIFIANELRLGHLTLAAAVAPIVVGAHFFYCPSASARLPQVTSFRSWLESETADDRAFLERTLACSGGGPPPA